MLKLPSRAALLLFTGFSGLLLSSCAKIDMGNKVLVSVRDQRMMILKEGLPVKSYPVSTSKFGLGDRPGSMYTPLGTMRIARKIGEGAPSGAVFKSRRRTGEILRPNSPGRDPIVSRIIWLKGMEHKNRNAYRRYIYIHGTPEERTINQGNAVPLCTFLLRVFNGLCFIGGFIRLWHFRRIWLLRRLRPRPYLSTFFCWSLRGLY